jgi:hypothetical protein
LTIRTVARPDKRVAEPLVQLGLQLPKRNRVLQTLAPSASASKM